VCWGPWRMCHWMALYSAHGVCQATPTLNDLPQQAAVTRGQLHTRSCQLHTTALQPPNMNTRPHREPHPLSSRPQPLHSRQATQQDTLETTADKQDCTKKPAQPHRSGPNSRLMLLGQEDHLHMLLCCTLCCSAAHSALGHSHPVTCWGAGGLSDHRQERLTGRRMQEQSAPNPCVFGCVSH
jgi:hypothetical protein